MTIRIKNWSKHQHFKDRTPPWIKLYREILDDPDWHDLDGDSAKLLIGLWLIASEDETHSGSLPDARKLAFRLRISDAQLNQALTKLSHWLICDDIKTISKGCQTDAPETETETETETEGEKREPKGSLSPAKLPTCPTQSIIDLYHSELPELPSIKILNESRKKAISGFWKWVLTSKRTDGENRANGADEAMAWIGSYFRRAKENDFLMGRNPQTGPHSSWQCDLDFLLTEKGKKHVIEKTKAAA